ncbi:DUF4249 domain-containing protein [Tenacibaculum xiamenense]|uniref:DUF4249 domain-containing protein n=1 Tax=Tenacibaculum xiamenense TaxID=1261553 RepID=UPI0038B48438
MKYIYKKFLFLLTIVFTVISCTEVIEMKLPEGEERLVVEANILWEKNTTGNEQEVKLSLTTPYYNVNERKPVTDATVRIVNTTINETYSFTHDENGSYKTTSFEPNANHDYLIRIVYKEEVYEGVERLMMVPEIQDISQSLSEGQDDEVLEVKFFYQDAADEENYYLTGFKSQRDLFTTYDLTKDEFINGNLIKETWEKIDDEDTNENEELRKDDVVSIIHQGISRQYYVYMNILINQYSSGQGGSPFQAIPVKLKGNIVNVTNKDNYCHGYFSVSEVSKAVYTVQ